jgi:anti-anti-sigma regulatory factor
MSDTSFAAGLVRGVPVVTAPVVVDAAGATAVQAGLQHWARHGHATLVVDLSRTVQCDRAGADMLAQAHRRAVAEGGELRLVAPSAAQWQALQAARPPRRFPTVAAAVAEMPAMAVAPDRRARLTHDDWPARRTDYRPASVTSTAAR